MGRSVWVKDQASRLNSHVYLGLYLGVEETKEVCADLMRPQSVSSKSAVGGKYKLVQRGRVAGLLIPDWKQACPGPKGSCHPAWRLASFSGFLGYTRLRLPLGMEVRRSQSGLVHLVPLRSSSSYCVSRVLPVCVILVAGPTVPQGPSETGRRVWGGLALGSG